MPPDKQPFKRFPSAQEDAQSSSIYHTRTPQTASASYKLSYTDSDFIMRDELRPVRLQLELMKPELIQQEHDIPIIFNSTICPFAAGCICQSVHIPPSIIAFLTFSRSALPLFVEMGLS